MLSGKNSESWKNMFVESIRGMAGFRNILVHEYATVDLKQVYNVLHTRLNDFREFARHVDIYIGSSRKSVGKLMSIAQHSMASDKGKRAFL
ncbi:MAG: DUF86 domain-containing protein [Nitrospirae bacterium]|nr:DUF86 domain-containing protein [Nitrospirota bacterium]MBI5097268.1 DUF86 domain-containing protein [Nitrospirota bacterium]